MKESTKWAEKLLKNCTLKTEQEKKNLSSITQKLIFHHQQQIIDPSFSSSSSSPSSSSSSSPSSPSSSSSSSSSSKITREKYQFHRHRTNIPLISITNDPILYFNLIVLAEASAWNSQLVFQENSFDLLNENFDFVSKLNDVNVLAQFIRVAANLAKNGNFPLVHLLRLLFLLSLLSFFLSLSFPSPLL